MKNQILGYLLSIPNSNINALPINKQKFYHFKDKLIRKLRLEDDGFDLQHILKICYSCEGTGKFTHRSGRKERCWKCRRGVFESTYVVLARYFLGGHLFHKPIAIHRFEKPKVKYKNEIKGYIQHKQSKNRSVILSFLLLTFFFDNSLFWVSLGCILNYKKNRIYYRYERLKGWIRHEYRRFWIDPAQDSVDDSVPF